MNNTINYKDLIAFHPGYYLEEVIEDLGISQAEFAIRLGTTPKTISTIVNGQINLSFDIAEKLSIMLGTSIDVWINLQNEYSKKVIEIEKIKHFDAQYEVFSTIDYAFFVRLAHLPSSGTINDKISNLCKYLLVSDLRVLNNKDFLVNYRMGIANVQPKNIINSRAWFQTAINLSKEIETKPFDAKKLQSFLTEIRSMTIKEPFEFVPRMKQIFAESGVAFVLLPHLKNSGVNGAVKWISRDRVVLAMNTRGAYADKFWFTLFHEIKHVLQQKIKTTFISGMDRELEGIDIELEDEANKFASEYLISPKDLQRFSPTAYTTDEEILEFAAEIGIHPGIVAGRLQHDKIINENRCSKMKEKYTIV